MNNILTNYDARAYLLSIGDEVEDAPVKWQRKGFDYYDRRSGQMLTSQDLVILARNEQELRG